MNIGKRLIQLRKEKNISQTDLAKKTAMSRTIIGNYERNENVPSLEVLIKISKVFNVSLDFLVGEGEMAAFNKDMLARIHGIEQLDTDTKQHVIFIIDTVIQNFNTKRAFSK